MTASSPRGTFSQAELTADRVITRCITRQMAVARTTFPAMPRNPGPLPARVVLAGADAGPTALTAELLGRVCEPST